MKLSGMNLYGIASKSLQVIHLSFTLCPFSPYLSITYSALFMPVLLSTPTTSVGILADLCKEFSVLGSFCYMEFKLLIFVSGVSHRCIIQVGG